ncbi:MAG: FkbM family methyltransferase [Reyranellaceae bacterium]
MSDRIDPPPPSAGGGSAPMRPAHSKAGLRLRECRYGKMLYRLNDTFIGRSLELYGEMGEQEVRALCSLVRPGDVVLEVGANIGTNVVPLARRVGKDGAVVAFEPQRRVHQMLCANVALNGLPNVLALWAAAGAAEGSIRAPAIDYETRGNFGGVALSAEGDGERVPVMTIDGLELQSCRLMKIDVEGMEIDVLRGAARTIARLQPRLYVENDRREKSPALISHLAGLGYRCYWHLPRLFNRDNFRGHAENVFGDIVSVNMLCLPPGDALDVGGLRPVSGPNDDWRTPPG